MAKIGVLENLPEINMLADEGITFESILHEMIADYEGRWKELTGEELILYPADSRRIMLNVAAGKLYQLATIINERHKLNFLQYMYGDFLKNWAGNFGFQEDGIASATITLRFYLSVDQPADIIIPAGTRATAGDQVYFATKEELVIIAGEIYADVEAVCTSAGTAGNGYAKGQINIIADPVNLVEKVENITESTGGHDEYTNQELRELIYNFPSTYSTAGPKECYEEIAKSYRSDIVDVRVITNKEAVVQIYVLLRDGILPDEEYRSALGRYIEELKRTPDTDKIEILSPQAVNYNLNITYYISTNQKDVADGLKEAIEDAVETFVKYTHEKIGRAINPSTLVSFTKAAGAYRLEANGLSYRALAQDEVAICTESVVTFGGLEEE
ncbi:MAG: baseplate J/gp47 family protein [Candidatus Gastranaerophilales bacterium]|nr:baseplate J/gp47 family protein [Candidatus Gastranaerophilales bacterium]